MDLLCVWEEQRDYERIRPLVPFGELVPERDADGLGRHPGALQRALFPHHET